jgi:hypothetical protein
MQRWLKVCSDHMEAVMMVITRRVMPKAVQAMAAMNVHPSTVLPKQLACTSATTLLSMLLTAYIDTNCELRL